MDLSTLLDFKMIPLIQTTILCIINLHFLHIKQRNLLSALSSCILFTKIRQLIKNQAWVELPSAQGPMFKFYTNMDKVDSLCCCHVRNNVCRACQSSDVQHGIHWYPTNRCNTLKNDEQQIRIICVRNMLIGLWITPFNQWPNTEQEIEKESGKKLTWK